MMMQMNIHLKEYYFVLNVIKLSLNENLYQKQGIIIIIIDVILNDVLYLKRLYLGI